MKNKKYKIEILPYVFIVVVVIFIADILLGGGTQKANERALAREMRAIPSDITEVRLNDLVPFEWDAVYKFGPYETESGIREVIGIQDGRISEGVSEEHMQIVFVDHQKEKVAANFCGSPENIGFIISLPQDKEHSYCKITKEENAVFTKEEKDGVVALQYKQSDKAAP